MAPSRPPRAPPRAPRDPKELLKKRGADLIRKISDKDRYGIFLQPVDVDAIDGYAQLIARPMDLSTCQNNLAMGVYRTPMELRTDLDLIWSNCCTFNADDSIYFKEAVRLRAVCARYYDDFVKALVKDGVAPALGLYRASGASSSARLPLEDHLAPAASVAHAASFRDVHLRRARANYDAAVTAAAAAIHEARQAAQAAGLPDAPPPAEGQIFKGPNNEFQDNAPAHAAASSAIHTQLFRSQRLRESCSQIPLAWRRIGRWHSRGATQSAFLTTERARDVRYGLKYEQFVRDSAPMARRLLASILDPQVVRQHDLAQMEKLSKQTTGSSSRVEHTLKKSGNLTPNGVHSDGKKNGVTDAMDVDKPAKASYDKLPKSKKRPRSSTELATANGVHMNATSSAFGEQLKDLIEPKRFKHVSPKRVDELSQASLHVPPKQSIYRVRSLLRSKGIDPKFVSAIMTDDAESYCADAQNNVAQDGVAASQQRKMEQLLNSNYAIMMNVLRLRALREGAAETMQESIEDKERDSVEMLANGLSLAVRSVPPRFVVHPADAAESALCMAQSINERQERVERQAKSSKGKT
ncbi:Bromodomain and PHD finger-containing protein 3 [Gracilariopsis chorda]|uniref:Bromodomain and PHD finger-containing protein 3 n=1 Tax=Gracilariopsis chorda TaxID=448386 RepID=A0A2V3IRT5_9FLOR|nr:Bromodomain and PHD finger-containing protein 3 [Gracilariopsis chorda]|eukprot:PXF44824.1 Bromodomain and PHD finger-containing protein 3 [Gracilariopsis chorda]